MGKLHYKILTAEMPYYSDGLQVILQEVESWEKVELKVRGQLQDDWEITFLDTIENLQPQAFKSDIFILRDANDKIQGLAICFKRDNHYHISRLITAPWNMRDLKAELPANSPVTKGIGSKLILLICQYALKQGYSHLAVVPGYIRSGVSAFYEKLIFESHFPPAKRFEYAIPSHLFTLLIAKLREHEEELNLNIEYPSWETLGQGVPWVLRDILIREKDEKSPRPYILFQEICQSFKKPLQDHELAYLNQALMHLSREMICAKDENLNFSFWIQSHFENLDEEFTIKDDTRPYLRIPVYKYYSQERLCLLDELFAYFIFLNLKMQAPPYSVNLSELPIANVLQYLEVPLVSGQYFPEQLAELWVHSSVNLLFSRDRRLAFNASKRKWASTWFPLKTIFYFWEDPYITELLQEKSQSTEGKHLACILSGYCALLHAAGQTEIVKKIQATLGSFESSNEEMPFVASFNDLIECKKSAYLKLWH